MRLRVSHLTRYYYTQKVTLGPHRVYLRPRESARQRLTAFRLDCAPLARVVTTLDEADNTLIWAYWAEPSAALNIHVKFDVETLDANPFDFLIRPDASDFPFSYSEAEQAALGPYLVVPDAGVAALVRAWLDALPAGTKADSLAFLSALNGHVRNSIAYVRRDEYGIQTSARTLETGTGSCRDFAAFLIDACRIVGLAARFVSGYLYEPPPDPPLNAPEILPTAMHAWVEVFLPGAGWRGLDPTRGIFCNDAFIPVAHAIRGERVSPIQGSFSGTGSVASELHADIVVERIG